MTRREPRLGSTGLGPRIWILTIIAAASTFLPTQNVNAAYASIAVFLASQPWRLRLKRTDWAAIALVGWMWASVRWAADPTLTQGIAQALTVMLVVYLTIRHVVTNARELRMIASGYLTGGALLVILVLTRGEVLLSGINADRATLQGINGNYLAYALAAGAAVCTLWWVSGADTLRRRVTMGLYVSLMLVGVLLTGTRGALLGIGLVAVWVVTYRIAPTLLLRVVVLGMVIFASLIVSGAADRSLLAFEGGVRSDQTLSGRLLIWPLARQLWSEHPWVGVGVGGFRPLNASIPAHNLFLETGVGLGVVGVVLVVVLFWAALGRETCSMPARQRALLVGTFIVATGPAYLSGAFEYILPSWVVLALFSRIALLRLPQSGQAVGVPKVHVGDNKAQGAARKVGRPRRHDDGGRAVVPPGRDLSTRLLGGAER